ncbi:HAMP domain-containing sensor histidine kinase [Marinobacter sp. S6332]|uniref:sensor histidine kinase n=1 Tax=Marinobacter sp. S6332 TaxID=2926403 RepID=UPI001FF51B5C|nr:HAMP domain-containing sensor histidine kinase [Marinobacter sp. S6332]MCK0164432.1 HAMP domain-containing histidine kinase [Marinobacter sp. S6332]
MPSNLREQAKQMRRSGISLRAVLIASFLALGLILALAYSLVSKEHFIRGLDAAMAGNMEKAARTFSEVFGAVESEQVREFSGFDVATQWSDMPDYALRAFPNGPGKSGQLFKQADSAWFSRPKSIVFAMRDDTAHGPLYMSQNVTPRQASEVLPQASRQNRVFALTVSILVIGFVSIVGWLLLWHVSRPMTALRAWTHSLDNEKLSDPVPDFSYPELNEMAELIRNSLSTVQQAVERERRFLRHASHELRTPISTIRSNIELQRKLTQKREKFEDEQSIVDRIDRASLTMKHLTETLLWLNHEPDTPLQSEVVDLSELVRELAAEMSYLLAGKPVTTEISTSPYSCTVPLVPARIILGNLIRNAYQHCWEGIVVIDQKEDRVAISNPAEPDVQNQSPASSENTGYGLGLELTTTLSQRIGWHYTATRHENLHCVTVKIGTRPEN